MGIRVVPFAVGEYYHLYNRGNSKQTIFHDDQDYRYFMRLLLALNNTKRSKSRNVRSDVDNGENIISIGSYCLMPNHFHILVREEKDGGISLFMQKLLTGYVMYYNKKYKRTGGLFEGRFKSKYAGEDRYLKYLFSYIHLNPLKIIDKDWKTKKSQEKYLTFLSNYSYSSYSEYIKDEYSIIKKDAFPDYFPTKSHFLKEIFVWLSFD